MDFIVRSRLDGFEPNADVFVDDDLGRVVAIVEVAGADPDTLRVGVDDRYLIVAGRRLEPVRLRRGSFTQKEIAYGEFAKRIHLPVAVEFEGASASYAEGLLIITAPVAITAYLPTSRTELHIMVKRVHS